jgi:hypothetical protein
MQAEVAIVDDRPAAGQTWPWYIRLPWWTFGNLLAYVAGYAILLAGLALPGGIGGLTGAYTVLLAAFSIPGARFRLASLDGVHLILALAAAALCVGLVTVVIVPLRWNRANLGRWLVAVVVGLVLGGLLMRLMQVIAGQPGVAPRMLLSAGAVVVGGLCLGGAQWVAIRRTVPHARLWPLAAMLASSLLWWCLTATVAGALPD